MPHNLRLCVALALASASGLAAAQSSITVFGVADLAIQHIKGTGTQKTQEASGALNGSRLGFKGQEDLGAGAYAGFHLEAGLNMDTGSGKRTSVNNVTTIDGFNFNRRSTVSLGGSYGEVRLGRDYTPVADNHTDYDVFGNNGVGDSSLLTQALAIGLVSGTGVKTDVRASNAVEYFLPAGLGGIFGYAMYAIGETQDGVPPGFLRNDGTHYGARLGYEKGNLNVAIAYGKTVLSYQDDLDNIHLGGWYKFGNAQLFAQLSRERTTVSGVLNTNDAAALGLSYAIGPSLLKAELTRSNIKRDVGGNIAATMIAFGYDYNLSRRTALHAGYSYIKNGEHGTFDLGLPVRPGDPSSGVQFGMRHRF